MEKGNRKLKELYENREPGREYTLDEIGRYMGITRERVRQIEMRALKKVRHRLQVVMKRHDITEGDFIQAFENYFHRNFEPMELTTSD